MLLLAHLLQQSEELARLFWSKTCGWFIRQDNRRAVEQCTRQHHQLPLQWRQRRRFLAHDVLETQPVKQRACAFLSRPARRARIPPRNGDIVQHAQPGQQPGQAEQKAYLPCTHRGTSGAWQVLNRLAIQPHDAAGWLKPEEPVVLVESGGQARLYPLQILIWHEIVNDTVGGVPVAVTFCPLCNASIVFDRTLDGQVLDFGTTGKLRNTCSAELIAGCNSSHGCLCSGSRPPQRREGRV